MEQDASLASGHVLAPHLHVLFLHPALYLEQFARLVHQSPAQLLLDRCLLLQRTHNLYFRFLLLREQRQRHRLKHGSSLLLISGVSSSYCLRHLSLCVEYSCHL